MKKAFTTLGYLVLGCIGIVVMVFFAMILLGQLVYESATEALAERKHGKSK